MTTQAKGKIYLSDERGCTEAEWFRSYNTFNFGKYQNRHKHAFNGLYVLNDDTLAGGRLLKLTIEESTLILLLPVVGAIVYKDSNGNEGIVNAGSLQIIYLHANATLELSNPYENDLVNFLQLWIKSPVSKSDSLNRLLHFNLENKNKLLTLTGEAIQGALNTELYPVVSIGKFTGRQEAVYKTQNQQNGVFVFIIQGAFEVQGRLLHARDGLGLWDEPNDIELEALSNDAIVLMVELA